MKKMHITCLMALLASGIAFGSGLNGTFTREYQNVVQVEMETVFIPTQITGHSGSVFKIEAYDIPANIEVFIEERNGHISIRVEQRSPNPSNVASRARFVISAPRNAGFDLRSASGSFALENLHGDTLKVLSASGSISCNDMSVPLELETSSGTITVNRSNTGKLVKSVSGAVSINQSKGDAVLLTISGRIQLDGVQGAVKATSSSGSLQVSNFEGRLYLTSVSGSISGTNTTIIGESNFETTSGSINLSLTNRARDVQYSASSVSGRIDIFDTRGSSRLQGGSGNTRLSLKTVSGSITVR